jgi:hypothetical protein
MIDYSEMIILIEKLTQEVHNDLNDKKLEEVISKLVKLEMSVSMLKKYVDWRTTIK